MADTEQIGESGAGAAASDPAHGGAEGDASPQGGRWIEGAAEGLEKAGRSLTALVEEAVAGMRSLVGAPGLDGGGSPEADEAMAKLVRGVMETNMRFAEELLRRAGPSTLTELQRRFLREYFGALAQGGASLVQAARQAADGSPRGLWGGEGGAARSAGKVADFMSRDLTLASPMDTVRQAARLMGEQGIGELPVVEDGRLVGVVTDRDLALRAAAAGKHPSKTKLREVMPDGEPSCVFDDDPVEAVAAAMAERQVRRMPVIDRGKRLVGMFSLDDVARAADVGTAGPAPGGVPPPAGRRTQEPPSSG